MFDEASIRALLLSLVAGLSTLLGAIIIFITNKKNEKLVTAALGFAAGIMISVSFTDLYPNAVEQISRHVDHKMAVLLSVFFIVLGIAIALLIDRFVPHETYNEETGETPHKNLYRVGFVSMVAIGLHNFPEGIATFMAGYEDLTLGISITIAIALHNIPEGISVALPLYFATGSRWKAFKYTLISGLAEPAGALLTFLLLRPFINPFLLGAIFAVITGIMIYIAIEELIPSSRQYGHDRIALFATLAGICVMPLTHII